MVGVVHDPDAPEALIGGPEVWVWNEDDLEMLCAQVWQGAVAVVDLETTGLAEHATTGGKQNGGVAARIALASITLPLRSDGPDDEPTTYVIPLSHPSSPWSGTWRRTWRRIAAEMVASGIPIENQNMKFDSKWTYACCRVDVSRQIAWDTQISSHMLDETRSTRLKDRAPETFGVRRWDDVDLTYPGAAEEVDLFDLGRYAARDTYWTWRLAREHKRLMFLDGGAEPETPEEIVDARLGLLAQYVAMPMVGSLTAIEQRGMALDVPWIETHLESYAAQAEDHLATMAGMYPDVEGTPSAAATSTWFKAWTTKAVEAGDLVVGAMTPKGSPKWSKSVLTRQARGGSQVAQLVLDQRHAAKMAEFLRAWLGYVTPEGTIHATYHAGRVVTGRLSASDPNMQQVTKVLKPAFVAREGMVLIDMDYSQIELRVAAFISRCVPMIEAFQRGDDLHTMLARQIVQARENARALIDKREPREITLDEITPEERQAGKSANFGLLYQMSALGFREYAEDVYGVSFTPSEAQTVHRTFFETWEGMREWHARQIARVNATGIVVSPIGRVRRLPGIWDGNPEMVGYSERASINAPVQGFASDIMQIAAAMIGGFMPGYAAVRGAHIVATVHDNIVVEAPEDDWQRVRDECVAVMTDGVLGVLKVLGCEMDVPLAVDAKVGRRWGTNEVQDAA